MGVWIETSTATSIQSGSSQSHPVWVCGLKLVGHGMEPAVSTVTPCMGVWIETIGA